MASSSDGEGTHAHAMNVIYWVCYLGPPRSNPEALHCVWVSDGTGPTPMLYDHNPGKAYLEPFEPYRLFRININTETGDVSICEEP